MSLPAPFDKFVFNDRLEKELRFFIENPRALRPVTCFSGEPGIGKTSFARAFATRFSQETYVYEAMNEQGSNLTEKWKSNLRLANDNIPMALIGMAENLDDGVWGQIQIFDEFHNLAPKQQDYFKTVFDGMNAHFRGNDYFRVILCINTDERKPSRRSARDVLSVPIHSRCHHIDFNTFRSEADAYVEKVSRRFPNLHRNEVACWVPDIRRIERESELRSMQTA